MSKIKSEADKMRLWNDIYGLEAFNNAQDSANIITNYMQMIAMQLFEYDGIEGTGFEQRHIERYLYSNGACVAFKYKNEYTTLPYVRGGERDIHGEPKTVTPHTAYSKLPLSEVTVNKNGVIIRNNNLFIPTSRFVNYWSYLMTNALISLDINLYTTRTPFIVKVDSMKRISASIYKDTLQKGGVYIVEDPDTATPVEVLNLTNAYCGDKIFNLFVSCQNMLLQMLGINNHQNDKKERLLVDEVNANNELIGISLDTFLKPRQECVDMLNKVFGTNIMVRPNENLIPPEPEPTAFEGAMEEEAEQNGS